MSDATVSAAHLSYDQAQARRDYGRRAFLVEHDLVGNPLFELDALAELAERLPPEHVEHNAGNKDVLVADNDALGRRDTAAETIRVITEQPGFVALPTTVPGVPRQAGYQELFEELLAEMAPMAGLPVGDLKDHHAVIFISSGGNTTPVHFDPEPSFLMHVRGTKRFSIGRHPDPQAERLELEAFYAHEGRNSPHVPVDVVEFDMVPGQALHVPPVKPHWVTNGPEVAISFSVGFQTAEDHRRRSVYQWNGRARKMGLKPKAHGSSELADKVKGGVMGTAFEARRRLKRQPA